MFLSPGYPCRLVPRARPASLVRFAGACAVILSVLVVACTSRDPAAVKADALRRGDDLFAKKMYGRAAAAYRTVIKIDPDDGKTRVKLANTYLLSGNYPAATAEATRGANLLPHDVDAQLLAAELLLTQQEFTEARERIANVLRKEPNNVRGRIISGNAAALLTNPAGALTNLDDAVRIRSDYMRLLVLPRDRLAEEAFRAAVRLAPTDLLAQIALANFLWATDRADEAEAPLKFVADSDPHHRLTNRALGSFYASRHRSQEAETYLKRAAEDGDRDDRLALADFYIKVNRENDALSILNAMETKDDASNAVTLRAAPLEFRLGKREQAMQRLDNLLAREPGNVRAMLMKAQFFATDGRWDQALRFAGTAVAQDPKSSEARIVLGKALFATGDPESAYQEFSEAFRADPESVQLPLQLADLSIELGRRQEALQYARDAVRKNPANVDAAVALVKTLVALRDYSSAEWELKSLLARHPSSADLLVQLGAVNLGRGDSAAARSAFARALQLDRDSLDGLSGMASLDLKERRIADVRKRVDEALAAHPQDSEYLLLAARVYAADNDAGRAESTFRRALDLDRANEGAALALSDFLNTQHRRDEAKRVLEQALERRPGSVAMQTSLGMLLEQMGRSTDAKALYEKIIGRTSRASTAASRLAALYVEQGGNLDVALSLATTAKQQLPDDPAISDVLGQVYTRKNLPGVAVRHLQEAVRAAPDNAVYRFHLGTAYLRDGQIKPARGELTRALQIDPTFAQADQARAALASMPK